MSMTCPSLGSGSSVPQRPAGVAGLPGETTRRCLYAPDTPPHRSGAGSTPHPWRFPLYEPYNSAMPVTIGDLLKTPGLDVRLVAGDQGVGGAIRWVHVSELE